MRPESLALLEELLSHAPGLIEDIDADTEEMLGTVPFIFAPMKERPDLFLFSALADWRACRPESLDARTAELMAVTAAAASGAPDCLKVHIRAALKEGASREEIRDCLFIAGVIGKTKILAAALRVFQEAAPEGTREPGPDAVSRLRY